MRDIDQAIIRAEAMRDIALLSGGSPDLLTVCKGAKPIAGGALGNGLVEGAAILDDRPRGKVRADSSS